MKKKNFKTNTVYDCNIFQLPRIKNRAGNITPLQNLITIPFEIKRVYYLYDIPGGEIRGGHAHKELEQFIIAVSGSFDVLIKDGVNEKVVNLNRPYYALHIKPGIWRELLNFSSGSVCLVLASDLYNEDDYIRSYDHFLREKKK